ncbi:amidase [Embleya sp. AB8]|uniref:amidase n=1 Tax=Embleya sp. AB8 TaxID=3156304 RepID=UPI003C709ADE
MTAPFATLTDTAHALRTGEISSRELVADAFAAADALDPVLGVYVARFDEPAALAAKRADETRAAAGATPLAPLPPLAGLPIAIKDNLATIEGPTTAQSPTHDPAWWRGRDADAVARLRAAGAIVLGKTTMVEYAMGRPDPAHPFPVPRNPWDPERWTGGSSTGNGAGLAAGLFLGALGSDTAGSVRLPAALCGVTGLKTTYGALPIAGCVPLSPSQDVLGPMGIDARDCALLLDAVRGTDFAARTWLGDLAGVRVGVPYELLDRPGVDPACAAAFATALDALRELGAEVRPFALPEVDALLAVNAVTMLAEAFAAHRRRLVEEFAAHGRSFRRLAVAGGLLPAHLYLRARRARSAATHMIGTRLVEHGVDVLATPTWPSGAQRYADEANLPGREPNLTAAWNPTGFPALALPMGVDDAGLPLSLQLVGPAGADDRLLAVGDVYQHATRWHLRRPTVDEHGRPAPLPDPDRPAPAAHPTPATAGAHAVAAPPAPAADPDRIAAALAELGVTPTPADLAAVTALTAGLRAIVPVLDAYDREEPLPRPAG